MANTSNIDIARAIYLSAKDKTSHDANFFKDIVKFLVRKRFLYRSKDILINLQKIVNQEHGVIEVKVKSARKLSEEVKMEMVHSLKKRYSAKEIIFKEILDEKLLGGMHIEVNDEIIDLTVKNKVKKLQEHLTRQYEP